MTRGRLSGLLAILAMALLGSCTDAHRASPLGPAAAPAASTSADAPLLACPNTSVRSASAVIGPLGGSVSVAGHKLAVPAGAVPVPTSFSITVPASQLLEVQIRAGEAEHYQFLLPVSLTLSYARCGPETVEGKRLQIVYIDAFDSVLQLLGGSDDRVSRAVTTWTDHLSDYAMGTNRTDP